MMINEGLRQKKIFFEHFIILKNIKKAYLSYHTFLKQWYAKKYLSLA